MGIKKEHFVISFLAVFLIIGCSSSDQGDKKRSSLTFDVTQQPFSVSLTEGEESEVGHIGGNDMGGLFYVTDQDTQYITDVNSVNVDSAGHFQASYNTTDGHTADVDVRQKENGMIALQFSVSPADSIIRKGMSLKAYDGESYYGLMERTVDGPQQKSWTPGITEGLDLRGQKLTMYVKPTPSIYDPFYVSSKGYGVYVDGTWPGAYDMAASKSNEVSLSFEGPELNVTLIPGPKSLDVVKHYNELVGPPILPPKWTFSVFHWRDEHHQKDTLYDGTQNTSPYNAELTEDILMLDALDIPNGVYWIDRPWAIGPEGYSDFEWDPQRFPNAEQMVDWVHSKDQKLLLWIAPWVMGDEMFSEAKQKGYLIPGSKVVNSKNPEDVRQLLDYTNPEAVDWWGNYLKRIIDDGIDGYKMDRSEEMMPDSMGIVLDNGKTAREMHNKYPALYIKGTYEQTDKHSPDDDFLLMPRAAYTSSRKYGGFWGGDIADGPWGLRTALIAVQRAAFMGYPYWGSDTGGYWGKKENFTHENLSRWLAFSCFTPIMEVGPLWNRAVWDMPTSPAYDTTLIATYRLYAKIHTGLKDYSYDMAQNAHQTGEPIVHPLAMAFPDDERAAARWDEFQYGHDILVGIIWKNDQRKFDMYLPEGSWKDAWTGEEYDGPTTASIDCPLYKIPIFTKSGSDVDLGDLNSIYQQSLDIARQKPDLKKILKEEQF